MTRVGKAFAFDFSHASGTACGCTGIGRRFGTLVSRASRERRASAVASGTALASWDEVECGGDGWGAWAEGINFLPLGTVIDRAGGATSILHTLTLLDPEATGATSGGASGIRSNDAGVTGI